MSRIPILYIAPWVIEGGSDKGTVDWFQNLDGAEFAKYLVTTRPSGNSWLPRVAPHADQVWDLPKEGLEYEQIGRRILEIIREKEIAIVHLMNSALGYELLPKIKALPNAPAVVSQLHTFDFDAEGRPHGHATSAAYRFDGYIDAYDVISKTMGDVIRALYRVEARKIKVIYLGVDTEKFHPGLKSTAEAQKLRQPGALNVVWVGRLDREKNVERLAAIIRRCKETGIAAFFHIVGDGSFLSEKAQLIEQLQRHDLWSHCRLYGFHVDVRRFYGAADLFLMTSNWEGLPLTLMEAMASGVPSMTPDVGAIHEFLDEKTGWTIPRLSTEVEFCDVLAQVAEAPGLLEPKALEARRRVEGVTVRRMVEQHQELYRSLVKNAGAKAEAGVRR